MGSVQCDVRCSAIRSSKVNLPNFEKLGDLTIIRNSSSNSTSSSNDKNLGLFVNVTDLCTVCSGPTAPARDQTR